MWIRVPGKNLRATVALGWLPALALVMAVFGPAWAQSKGEAPSAPSPPAPAATEIILTGKLFTSLKRGVELPFRGTITSLLVKSGQQVAADEVLATYLLAPEAVLSIRQRLFPARITEAQVKLTAVERAQVPLKSKKKELSHLVQKKLAPAENLNQLNRESQLLGQEQAALREQLRHDRQTLALDQALLKKQLGNSLKDGQVPSEAVLRAPIAGHVIWINPEMREGAELPPLPASIQIGVMDPMVVRVQAFEIEAQQIQPGEVAQVTLESLPGKKFTGTVSRVSWSALTPTLDQPSYYDVELTVPNPDLLLKEGLKARIVFTKSR